MKTLLERAKEKKGKKVGIRGNFPFDEELELTLAWLNGEIGSTQYGRAVKDTNKLISGSAMYRIASFLRDSIMNKKIKIVKIK